MNHSFQPHLSRTQSFDDSQVFRAADVFRYGIDLQPDLEVGGFVLIQELQVTACAALWLAKEKGLNRIVSLRIFSRTAESGNSAMDFQDAARSTAQLEHKNISQVFSVGREGKVVFVAREWVPGSHLLDFIEEECQNENRPLPGSLPFAEPNDTWNHNVVRFVLELANTLKYAHSRGVPHGAFWPGNIILAKDGGVKLIDFSAGRNLPKKSLRKMSAWLAPRVSQGERASKQDDVYSLGVLLYQLLMAELPPATGSNSARHQQLLLRMKRNVPTCLRWAIFRALSQDQVFQFAAISEFIQELEQYLTVHGTKRRLPCCAWFFDLWKSIEFRFQRRFYASASAKMYVR